jgi:hypothetical protein
MDSISLILLFPNAEVTTSRDVPGFVANALLMPYINEVSFSFSSNVAFDIRHLQCSFPNSSFLLPGSIDTDFLHSTHPGHHMAREGMFATPAPHLLSGDIGTTPNIPHVGGSNS